jgi:nucleotide-binding universal stress UspA family protein
MAVVTTMMAGPLLRLIYPDRFLVRDLAEADRAMLGTAAAHPILVLIEAPEAAAALVEVGAALAASREHSGLILVHVGADQRESRLDTGTGLGGELLDMSRSTGNKSTDTLQALARQASARGVPAVVQSLSQDLTAELPGYVAAAEPDTIVLGPGGTSREKLAGGGAIELVTVPLPPATLPPTVLPPKT